jgi:CheY-like chemotaxis protein
MTGQFTPIVALTANAQRGDREQCIEAGMNDYLSKPIHGDALTVVVSRWLSGAEKEAVVSETVDG